MVVKGREKGKEQKQPKYLSDVRIVPIKVTINAQAAEPSGAVKRQRRDGRRKGGRRLQRVVRLWEWRSGRNTFLDHCQERKENGRSRERRGVKEKAAHQEKRQ